MTDLEHKAEESYAEYSKDSCVDLYESYQYIDGLKDGYTEAEKNEIHLLENIEIKRLVKENEELKKENDILIKGLGCETCSIHLEYENLNNQIEELKAQIEKMKGCSNCANGLRNGLLCDRQLECRKNNNKLWELAE